jgi:hypothetical protein
VALRISIPTISGPLRSEYVEQRASQERALPRK